MPDKDSGYVLDEGQSYCGVNGEKDENIEVYLTEDWFIHVGNMKTSRTKCTLYFVKGKFFNGKGIPVVEEGNGLYIVEHTDSELDDEWKKTEYRYAGEDPNNYVWFNEELWRMIGFVNVKTSDGHVEQRVKIIKGNNNGSLAWDSSRSNDWTKASLMTYLNGEYHDQFKDRSKNMVDEGIIWSIGAGNSDLSYTPNNFYETERGTTTYNSQPSEWKKETENDFHSIGLMYPSDYGWASTGVIDNKEKCINVVLNQWNTATKYKSCVENNWLFYSGTSLLTSFINGFDYISVISSLGNVTLDTSRNVRSVYPTLYLKANVKITGGTGEASNPFKVALWIE